VTKPISLLTYKIVTLPYIQQIDVNESIDWAIEMIELGYESLTLYMLSSFSKPANYFEIIKYVTETVDELGLTLKDGEEAILSYAGYYVYQIAKGHKVRENLTEIYTFCQSRNYEGLIYDFHLLHWAWDQLDYEDSKFNHYWSGATRANIETIVIEESKKWLKKNEMHFAQSIT